VVSAIGAIERPLSFAGNDKPGVMLASAMRDYVTDYGVSPATGRWSSPTTTTPTAPPSR
jgi:NADPH-dependent 2,4-dienoyl-CoA reductase/sulfur reductase-like enzyme